MLSCKGDICPLLILQLPQWSGRLSQSYGLAGNDSLLIFEPFQFITYCFAA